MSDIWKRVSLKHPCPICQKTDWCQFGDRAMKCMRVESEHACASGGWYHFYDRPNPDFLPSQHREVAAKSIDAAGMMLKFKSETTTAMYVECAEQLGVAPESLHRLGAAWSQYHRAWAFPMRDGQGTTIGIRLRNVGGFKWAVRGSLQGVFVPSSTPEPRAFAYLPEGPTDVAAALSIGLFAIGRPNCQSGAVQIRMTMLRLGISKAVIVADNDDLKRLGDHDGRPGIEGALKLKRELGVQSVIWTPPSPLKDIRAFVQAGGNRVVIESQIRNKIWGKK